RTLLPDENHDQVGARRRYGLGHSKLADSGPSRGISNDRRPRHLRRNLFEQFHPFCGEAVFKLGKAGNVTTGPCQTFDEAATGLGGLGLLAWGRKREATAS